MKNTTLFVRNFEAEYSKLRNYEDIKTIKPSSRQYIVWWI